MVAVRPCRFGAINRFFVNRRGGETVSTGTLKRRWRVRRPEDGAKTFGNVQVRTITRSLSLPKQQS